MARPIKETPILRGEDAKRFREAIANPKRASQEKIDRMNRNYELAKKRATFLLP
jgi:hypothetical protein